MTSLTKFIIAFIAIGVTLVGGVVPCRCGLQNARVQTLSCCCSEHSTDSTSKKLDNTKKCNCPKLSTVTVNEKAVALPADAPNYAYLTINVPLAIRGIVTVANSSARYDFEPDPPLLHARLFASIQTWII